MLFTLTALCSPCCWWPPWGYTRLPHPPVPPPWEPRRDSQIWWTSPQTHDAIARRHSSPAWFCENKRKTSYIWSMQIRSSQTFVCHNIIINCRLESMDSINLPKGLFMLKVLKALGWDWYQTQTGFPFHHFVNLVRFPKNPVLWKFS